MPRKRGRSAFLVRDFFEGIRPGPAWRPRALGPNAAGRAFCGARQKQVSSPDQAQHPVGSRPYALAQVPAFTLDQREEIEKDFAALPRRVAPWRNRKALGMAGRGGPPLPGLRVGLGWRGTRDPACGARSPTGVASLSMDSGGALILPGAPPRLGGTRGQVESNDRPPRRIPGHFDKSGATKGRGEPSIDGRIRRGPFPRIDRVSLDDTGPLAAGVVHCGLQELK